MDEFAQTREPDNLFADDFTPIDNIVVVHPVDAHPPVHHQARRSGHPSKPSATSPSTTTSATGPNLPGSTNADAPSTARTLTAVRGDRSATGGISKPKLSESELSTRLAAAKLNNARREEAHRAAEADEASFQRREAEASRKRREEGIVRKAMEREREKNRLRKLGARDGREWDEGKQEQDTGSAARGGSQYRRGVYGGTAAHRSGVGGNNGGRDQGEAEEGYRYEEREDFGGRGYGRRGNGDRGRGGDRSRGERGRGGGRGGRGRGGHEGGRRGGEYFTNPSSSPAAVARHPPTNTETDFPSLQPPTRNPKSEPESKPEPKSSYSSKQVPSAAPPNSSLNPQNTTTSSHDDYTENSHNNTAGNPHQSTHAWKPDVEPFSPDVLEKQSWSDEVEAKASSLYGGQTWSEYLAAMKW